MILENFTTKEKDSDVQNPQNPPNSSAEIDWSSSVARGSVSIEEERKDDESRKERADEECKPDANTNSKKSKSSDIYNQYIQEHRYKSNETKRRRVIYKWTYNNCGRKYNKRWNLVDHIKTHLAIMPYEWDVWEAKFVQKGNLKKHMRQHVFPDIEKRKGKCFH